MAGRGEAAARRDLVLHARLLQARGYVVGADGNLSVRVGEQVLITPSRVDYAALRPAGLALLDLDGNGRGNPSSEREVHLAVYRARPDVWAVVHAHPVYACVLAVNREPLPELLDEVGPVLGGEVRVALHQPSGSAELGVAAVEALGDRQAVLLAGHGTVTVGGSLAEAFYRLEVLERAAQVYVLARLGRFVSST
ncbi:MAG TPA: class II aldolase/adducin family protein [Candidatus Acidoferrales bacterium]|nr:class II aldolase/adducin family protein [Candidatus Acidoferrales bacterium]